MSNPNHHPDCPRCKGEGFYLRREEYGFYRDGSFGGNDWQDCTCDPWMPVERLPKAVDPRRPFAARGLAIVKKETTNEG